MSEVSEVLFSAFARQPLRNRDGFVLVKQLEGQQPTLWFRDGYGQEVRVAIGDRITDRSRKRAKQSRACPGPSRLWRHRSVSTRPDPPNGSPHGSRPRKPPSRCCGPRRTPRLAKDRSSARSRRMVRAVPHRERGATRAGSGDQLTLRKLEPRGRHGDRGGRRHIAAEFDQLVEGVNSDEGSGSRSRIGAWTVGGGRCEPDRRGRSVSSGTDLPRQRQPDARTRGRIRHRIP